MRVDTTLGTRSGPVRRCSRALKAKVVPPRDLPASFGGGRHHNVLIIAILSGDFSYKLYIGYITALFNQIRTISGPQLLPLQLYENAEGVTQVLSLALPLGNDP